MRDLIKTVSGAGYKICHGRTLLRGRGCTVMVSAGRHVRRTVRQMMVGFQRWMARPTPEKRTPAALSCSGW